MQVFFFDSGAGWFGYSWIRVGRSVCMSLSICPSGEERAALELLLAQDV